MFNFRWNSRPPSFGFVPPQPTTGNDSILENSHCFVPAGQSWTSYTWQPANETSVNQPMNLPGNPSETSADHPLRGKTTIDVPSKPQGIHRKTSEKHSDPQVGRKKRIGRMIGRPHRHATKVKEEEHLGGPFHGSGEEVSDL